VDNTVGQEESESRQGHEAGNGNGNGDGEGAGEAGRGGEAREPQARVAGRMPPLRLLETLRERLRYMHYSLRTEEAYVHWVRGFVRWARPRHPRDLGAAEVQDSSSCWPTSAASPRPRIGRR
jgi:hypothetical protein